MSDEKGLINIPQAVRLKKISYDTIYSAARDGRIRGAYLHPLGGVWVFPREAFIEWAETAHRSYKRRKENPQPQRQGS